MTEEPTLEFMAIRLQKKARPQFIANWSLKTILFCLGSFAKDGTQGSSLRLSHPRVRRIANEWLSAGAIPPAPPLMVVIGQGSSFAPLSAHPEIGIGTLKLPLSKIIDVCDGIHRIAALRQLDLPSMSLTESEWPVEFIESTDREDAACLIESLRKEWKQPTKTGSSISKSEEPIGDSKCAYWLGKLANLNAFRTEARGIAPHKPLMLLSVIDLIEAGEFKDAFVPYQARLVSQFRSYWDLVLDRQRNRPDIAMPFNALGGDRDSIWERFDEHGNPSKSKLTTRLCKLAPDLFACLQDPSFRMQARSLMIARYFTPSEQVGISERLGLPIPDSAAMAEFKQNGDSFKASQKKGRDSRFNLKRKMENSPERGK